MLTQFYKENIGFEKDGLDLDRLLIHELALGNVISPGISEYEPVANKEILSCL